jgi:hypothetical protein
MLRARLQFVLLILVFGFVVSRESQKDPLQKWDSKFAGWMHRLPSTPLPVAPVTLVEINDESLQQHPWPWTPLDFALFFQAANGFHPDLIAASELFHWNDPSPSETTQSKLPQYRKLLRDHLLKTPKVVLGSLLGFPEDPQRLSPLIEVPLLGKFSGDPREIPEFTDVQSQPDEDFRLSSATGFINPPASKESAATLPLLLRYRGQLVPSLVLQTAVMWEKLTLEDVFVEIGKSIHIGDRLEIPINSRGEMPVNLHSQLLRCSFDDLLLSSHQKDAAPPAQLPPNLHAGRLFFLTRNDSTTQDLSVLGHGKVSSGEWMASGLSTILTNSFPRPTPPWIRWSIIGGVACLGLLPSRSRALQPWILAPVAFLLYLAGAAVTFKLTGLSLPGVLPLSLCVLLLGSRWFSAPPAPHSLPSPPPTAPETAPLPPSSPAPTSGTHSETGTSLLPSKPAPPPAPLPQQPPASSDPTAFPRFPLSQSQNPEGHAKTLGESPEPPPRGSIPIPRLALFPPKPSPAPARLAPQPEPSTLKPPKPTFRPSGIPAPTNKNPLPEKSAPTPGAPPLVQNPPLQNTADRGASAPPPSERVSPGPRPFTLQKEPTSDSQPQRTAKNKGFEVS